MTVLGQGRPVQKHSNYGAFKYFEVLFLVVFFRKFDKKLLRSFVKFRKTNRANYWRLLWY